MKIEAAQSLWYLKILISKEDTGNWEFLDLPFLKREITVIFAQFYRILKWFDWWLQCSDLHWYDLSNDQSRWGNTNTNTQCVLHMNDVSNPNYNESKDKTMKALWWHNLYMASLGRRANTNTITQWCVSNPAMIKVSGKTMTMKVLWWHNLDKASLDRRANTYTGCFFNWYPP